jgi:hypothetical protein
LWSCYLEKKNLYLGCRYPEKYRIGFDFPDNETPLYIVSLYLHVPEDGRQVAGDVLVTLLEPVVLLHVMQVVPGKTNHHLNITITL